MPVTTYGALHNARASGTLAANTSENVDVDASAVHELHIAVRNTPGGTVAATRGLRVDVFEGYGTAGTAAYSTIALMTYTLPSTTASTLESKAFTLPTGKFRLTLVNLDATNAITVSVTTATVAY